MRRRTLLASLATLAGTAGCVSGGEGAAPQATESPTSSPTDVHTDTRTTTETPPQPDAATDVFADVGCPSFDDHADETVCYHDADVETADLLLTAEPEVFDPYLGDDDVEALQFVLYNQSDWPIGFNPYAWGIERHDDGEWSHVAPETYPEPFVEQRPGTAMRWILPAESGSPPAGDDVHPLSVALDPGVYAFHLTVSYGGISTETPTDQPKPADRVELVALFRLEQAIDPSAEETSSRSTETGSP